MVNVLICGLSSFLIVCLLQVDHDGHGDDDDDFNPSSRKKFRALNTKVVERMTGQVTAQPNIRVAPFDRVTPASRINRGLLPMHDSYCGKQFQSLWNVSMPMPTTQWPGSSSPSSAANVINLNSAFFYFLCASKPFPTSLLPVCFSDIVHDKILYRTSM